MRLIFVELLCLQVKIAILGSTPPPPPQDSGDPKYPRVFKFSFMPDVDPVITRFLALYKKKGRDSEKKSPYQRLCQ